MESDHGPQYTSLVFSKRLEEAGVLGSMGSVGDAPNNAVAESFYATLQTELLERQAWPTHARLRLAIFEYIEVFYKSARAPLSPGIPLSGGVPITGKDTCENSRTA